MLTGLGKGGAKRVNIAPTTRLWSTADTAAAAAEPAECAEEGADDGDDEEGDDLSWRWRCSWIVRGRWRMLDSNPTVLFGPTLSKSKLLRCSSCPASAPCKRSHNIGALMRSEAVLGLFLFCSRGLGVSHNVCVCVSALPDPIGIHDFDFALLSMCVCASAANKPSHGVPLWMHIAMCACVHVRECIRLPSACYSH